MPYNDTSLFGGQGWIRTIEDIVDGFTVRCIWPLCNLPKTRKIFTLKNLSKKWSWRKESNLQPADYKSAALPLSHTSIVSLMKIPQRSLWCPKVESNHRHKDFQSFALPTELSNQMAVPTRIELAIFCVTGRRDNRYTTEPLVAEEGFEPTTFGL